MVTKRRPTPIDRTAMHNSVLDDSALDNSVSTAHALTWSWSKIIGFGAACVFLGACLMFAADQRRNANVDTVSLGFVRDMIDHHDQAVQMAVRVQSTATDLTVRQIAMDIVQEQRYELGMMDSWLVDWNKERGEDDRVAMAWMNMGSPVDQMMGMQDPDAVRALSTSPSSEAELSFLTMMQDHHRGGVHMAQDAAKHADSERVRKFAQRVVSVQNSEIAEMQAVIDRLQAAK
jgi:uncharacterized protein (DUF305 family)